MKEDIRYLLGAGVGIAVLAWLVVYYSQIGNLTQTAVTGYGGLIHDLEPPSMSGAGGFNMNPSMTPSSMSAGMYA